MPGETFADDAAAAAYFQGNRGSLGTAIPTYAGSQAHHVIPVSLIANSASTTTGSDIARLVEFAHAFGQFQLHDPYANGLVMPAPPVVKGQSGRVMPLDSGPRMQGLEAAKRRLAALDE